MSTSESSNGGPVVLNMQVCDGAHRDPGSGKWSLLGLFNSINARDFPVAHPQMVVYLAIAKVTGKQPLRLQFVHGERKDEVLYKMDAELSVTDPRAVADLVIPLQRVAFVRPGEHPLQVLLGGQFLAERPIYVNKTA